MTDLPNKEIMRKNGTYNKISKIYKPLEHRTFKDVNEAKDYFLTKEAQESFKYCCDTKFVLTDNQDALHWTINFGVPNNSKEKPWADCWKDTKQSLTDNNNWFKNLPNLVHDAKNLF